MKIKKCICILTITMTLALTACSVLPAIDSGDDLTDVNAEYVTIGNILTVHNADDRLTLLHNMDTLSSDGLYYATWTAGDPEPYENSDGDTVDLYDAQLYLLLGKYKNAETAQENMDSWLNAGRSNYDVTEEGTILCGEQSYTVITYTFTNQENPYARGVSAFGVYENCAVCVELTCREGYDEDLQEMLIDFLQECTYGSGVSSQLTL